MTCTHALELVEPIAAGELDVDAAARAHFESCPACASALATARRIEAVLAVRPAPPAPDRFEGMVLQRISRERWRAEVQVDRLFNVAVAVSIMLVVGGLAALMNLQGVLAAVGGMWEVVSASGTEALRNAVPTLSTYVAAAGLLLSALAMWWWADSRVRF
jgi:anti-sigma factor RsiW